MEEWMEALAEKAVETEDLSTLFDELEKYHSDPLNINSAGYEELKSLYVLSDFQIAALLDYRQKNGPLLSLYELVYIPGFRDVDMLMIQPWVFCGKPEKPVKSFRQAFKHPRQQLIVRYQQVLEQQAGYRNLPDSLLEADSDRSRYLGNPAKIYCRYSLCSHSLRTGFLAEKDAGEEFFKGSNRQGFDFYSAFADKSNTASFFKYILLGDYNVRIGQGLLAWSSYSSGITSDLSNMNRSAAMFQGNSSVEENRFLRGAAFTIGNGNFEFSGFASDRQLDASPADTSPGNSLFTGLTETGYHCTPSDLQKEDILRQTTLGASIRVNLQRLKAGLNGLTMHYNMDCIGGDRLYQSYQFRGSKTGGISLDYRILLPKVQIFGETAFSYDHFATINAMLWFIKPEISLGVIQRHYDKSYYSYYANAFGENTAVNNEDGFFLGADLHFSKTTCQIYTDIFSFPWLRYGVNVPAYGCKLFMDIVRKIRNAEISLRYACLDKQENYGIEDHLYTVDPYIKEKFRINSKVPLGSFCNLKYRFEIIHAARADQPGCLGYLISQDILVDKLKVPWQLVFRICYFNASDYDSRIYIYEREVYTGGSSHMLYGKGWRYMALIRWDAGDHISFRAKIAQSIYPGVKNIGSGLSAIKSNHRTELRVQMLIRV
jgi:hypothetical protein